MISTLSEQQLVLLGVAAHKLYSQPIALAAYSVLLERAAEAGGEAIPVTASGLGGAINVGGKTATQALCYLEEKGFITIGQKRTKSKRIIYISIVSLNCESILEKDVVTNGVTNEVTNGVTNVVTNGVTKKKEKETKEAVSPQTPFPQKEKKKRKKGRRAAPLKKKRRKKRIKRFFQFLKRKRKPMRSPPPLKAQTVRARVWTTAAMPSGSSCSPTSRSTAKTP